jgi:hypothetical protein
MDTDNSLRVGQVFTDTFTGFDYSFTDTGWFTDFYRNSLRAWNTVFSFMCFEHCAACYLYPYYRLLCVFFLGLYAVLPIVLTIVHFDGTPIQSLHNIKLQDYLRSYILMQV